MNESRYEIPVVADLVAAKETFWCNDSLRPFGSVEQELGKADIADAAARLQRFAPFIQKAFPETAKAQGIIESPLREIAETKEGMKTLGAVPEGRLFLKMDSHLAVAGSVKARGGIYEVLKHTEEIAFAEGLLQEGDDYAKLTECRDIFAGYTVQVGSTGNLGLSIGISSAAVGYRVVVHMSNDAKQWKKDLLRSKGVEVKEYAGDYGKAVAEGRALSDADPKSYFVDDETALQTARELAQKEGLLCGISSGTNVAAALALAKKLGKGKTVVAILPDTGERYFTTPLFE